MEIELASGAPADLYPTIGAERGVVIVPDLAGRRPLFAEMAAGLCNTHSWNVVVVDPIEGADPSTAGDPGYDRDAAVSRLDDTTVVADLVDAANRLEIDPVAMIGFGFGGMYAFKASASHRFDRIVGFYGVTRLPEPWNGAGQRDPLRLIEHAASRSAILAITADDDPSTNPDDIEQLARLGVVVARYDKVEAGFAHLPDQMADCSEQATDAWSRAISHIKAGGDADS